MNKSRLRKVSLRLVLFLDSDRMMFTPDGRYLIVDVRADSIDPAYR